MKMKINCNRLPIGAPGTHHIRWESAGRMIERHSAAIAESRVSRWTHPGKSRRS